MKIVLASKNTKKLLELRAILSSTGAQICLQSDVGLDLSPEETGSTFQENALIKAREISALCGLPALADDSGLCVDALGGEPGVRSARYAGENAGDGENNSKLLSALADVPDDKRGAKFVSVIAFFIPGRAPVFTRGECRGVILREARGTRGFGYDPLFYCPEYGKTFAEMSSEEKNAISHRAAALREFKKLYQEGKY